MISWSQFKSSAPTLASFGEERISGRISYLATIRSDGSPRLHPISPFISQGRLYVYMEPSSPKGRDLLRDNRYALHCTVEDNSGGRGEFLLSGQGEQILDADLREQAFESARAGGYNPQERYILFELKIGEAMGTIYEGGEPDRRRWKVE